MFRRIFGFAFMRPYTEYGPLFLRLLIGAELIRDTQDNILDYARMVELAHFLQVRSVPFPLAVAFVSVYSRALCGLLFILGLWTRQAGALMVLHFVFVFFVGYVGAPWQASYPVYVMLASALFFLFHGAGKLSLDDRLER